jgi:hypothetical protein
LEPSRPGTPISMESPREKDPSPAPVRVVCAVAHAGAPVGGCRADHGPRSGCAARRIATQNAGLKYLGVRLQSHFYARALLTTISGDGRHTRRTNPCSHEW